MNFRHCLQKRIGRYKLIRRLRAPGQLLKPLDPEPSSALGKAWGEMETGVCSL